MEKAPRYICADGDNSVFIMRIDKSTGAYYRRYYNVRNGSPSSYRLGKLVANLPHIYIRNEIHWRYD